MNAASMLIFALAAAGSPPDAGPIDVEIPVDARPADASSAAIQAPQEGSRLKLLQRFRAVRTTSPRQRIFVPKRRIAPVIPDANHRLGPRLNDVLWRKQDATGN